jgi:hypothetical protein
MWHGIEAIDRRHGERVRIRSAEWVPEHRDLFGVRHPAYERLIVEFPDGRWANDRRAEDLLPV